jgi:crossover junction endodeoxyribonuclease RuvC
VKAPYLFWGVDPGTQGGVAVISRDRSFISVQKFSDKTDEQIATIFGLFSLHGSGVAALEKVNAFPGEGVSSAFTFGNARGFAKGLLLANGIDVRDVTPQTWQRGMALGGSYANKTARKNAHKDKAKILFPHIKKITLEICDALLLAEYAYRFFQ